MQLSSDGGVQTLPQGLIAEDENTTGLLMDKVRDLFNWSDPVGWRGDLEKMERVVDEIGERIKHDMRMHIAEIRMRGELKGLGSQSPPTPTHDPQSPPASPESPGGSDAP